MRQIANGIKYWGQLLLLPIYWLSFLFPRDKQIWLFGSTFGRRFADNPRYFYLYVSQNCKDVRAIWISHNKDIVSFLQKNGYEAYYYHSLKGIWFALRGKVYLFDNYSKDINFWTSGGAIKVNLWHGVGNKQINYDNQHDRVRHPRNLWERFIYFPRRLSDEKPSHYILSTSSLMSEIFARAFQVPKNHIIEAGYPRNDILFEHSPIHNLYLPEENILQEKIREWKKAKKTILIYAPTFRSSEIKFMEVMNLEVFDKFLAKNDMIMLCKLHPKSVCIDSFASIQYNNIHNVSPDIDINSFLRLTDIMIADYSSVYSDYMLLNKPVVAFHYDYREYNSDTRDAYFDWEEYMPVIKAYTMEELEDAIVKVLPDNKENPFRSKMFTYNDEKSSERLVEKLLALCLGKPYNII